MSSVKSSVNRIKAARGAAVEAAEVIRDRGLSVPDLGGVVPSDEDSAYAAAMALGDSALPTVADLMEAGLNDGARLLDALLDYRQACEIVGCFPGPGEEGEGGTE